MSSVVSGLAGYNFYLDGVRLNGIPIPEGRQFSITGLNSSTDYTGRIVVKAVDHAGNESTPVAPASAITQQYSAGDSPMADADKAAVDNIVTTVMAGSSAADGGCHIGIVGPKGQYYKAYGSAYGRALTLDDRMRFGSITKMATATLVLRQIDQGHLSFDDKLNQFVTGVPNGDRITIKHLLMMRAGLLDYLQQDAAHSQSYFLNPTQVVDPLPWIRSYAPLYEPGQGFNYSNSCYVLLGEILKWCDAQYGTGRDVRTIILEDFCQAVGMTESEWPTGNYMTAPYSRGWADNAAYATIQSLGIFAFLAPLFVPGVQTTPTIEFTAASTTWGGSAGALDGTIHDLVKFGEALRDGALISPALKQQREETFQTYATYTPAHPWEGDGWSGAGLGVMQFGQWLGWVGNLAGYNASLFYNIVNGAVIAITTNDMNGPSYELFLEIRYLLWPDSVHTVPQIVRPAAVTAEADQFGTLDAYKWHAPGDADGKTELPHKIPFYV